MKIELPEQVVAADQLGAVHFIGIGGAGLSGIARLMHQQGVKVSGSDQNDSDIMASLRSEGIECFVGHRRENVVGSDTVIASTAVPENNPEIIAALAAGIRLWPRSAGLMSAMLSDTRMAVAGTHGKTTTTAMLTLAMRAASVDVSFAIGAEVRALGTNARRGTAGIMVVESDESDGAFLHYAPHTAIITNIDADHLDSWGTVEAYETAFLTFVDSVSGEVIASADDEGCQRLIAQRPNRITSVGFTSDADISGRDLVVSSEGTRFWVDVPQGPSLEIVLAVSGAHYAIDALLAFVCGWRAGADPQELARGLSGYTGASRRMEFKGEAGGISVTDSYAHHPTEIAADVAAARAMAADRRLVVVFQPHLVSRTRVFGARMGHELSAADLVCVADIYLARESPDPGVSSELVAQAIEGPPVVAGGPITGLVERLMPHLEPGDFVLTLGAGDITTVGPALLETLTASTRGI